jgi:hypothetical protein
MFPVADIVQGQQEKEGIMTYNDIIAKVSDELDLPKKFVDKVYRSYWRAVREHISSLPLKEDLTDEEFMKLQPNVNIPSLGKLYVTLGKYRAMKEGFKLRNNLKEKKDVTCNSDKASI